MTQYVSSVVPPGGGAAVGVILENVPCEASVFVGAAVRMDAGTAKNALADDRSTANVIGIVQSKSSSTLCNIVVAGITLAVFTGLDETKNYYLSNTTPGGLITAAPTTSGHVLVRIGQPFNSTQLVVTKGEILIRK